MARWAAMLQICSSELQGYCSPTLSLIEIAWANSIDSKSDKIKVDRRQRNRAQTRPLAKKMNQLNWYCINWNRRLTSRELQYHQKR